MTTLGLIEPGYREWAEDYMDPLNEVLFDMRDDGGSPLEIALFLVHRAVAELVLDGVSRGEAHKMLSEHVHMSVSSLYAYDGLNVEGTA